MFGSGKYDAISDPEYELQKEIKLLKEENAKLKKENEELKGEIKGLLEELYYERMEGRTHLDT